MAKIPFTLEAWLKDKSQRVIDNEGNELVICSFEFTSNEPYIHAYEKKNGCGRKGYKLDEVFFCPEPELTEFELRLLDWLSSDTCGEIPMEKMKECVKNRAAELFELARREFNEEQYTSDPRKTDLYKLGKAEALKDLPRWKKIKALDLLPCPAYLYNLAYERENNFYGRTTIHGLLIPNEAVRVGCDTWYLPVDDIKNLPKEDEKK